MEECVSSHQLLLSENFIVQPVENVPISIIEYGKLEMTQLINSGQISNVIQLSDANSNLKPKELHPLEMEIQRDFELKQQQESLTKHQQSSGMNSALHIREVEYSDKVPNCLELSRSLFEGSVPLQGSPNRRENALDENMLKTQENSLSHIHSMNRQMGLEKRQLIIVSDDSVFFNVPSKDTKQLIKDTSTDILKSDEKAKKFDVLNGFSEQERNKSESDSENEEDDVQPVYDYEPDPDNLTITKAEQDEKPNKCYMCFKSFRQKKNMYAHIRRIHSAQPKIEGGILCPLCKMHALRQEHLRNHLESLHEIPIAKEEILFNTMEDFLSWKESMEKETLSFYVSKSSSKLLANNQQKTYYKCHRSGNYVTLKKDSQKRNLKMQGSNKIGATCPAALEVIENTHGINVIFWKTHVGHDNDLEHLGLTMEDKDKIMGYVASGLSWDKILQIVKKEEIKCPEMSSRLPVPTKHSLRSVINVKKGPEMKSNSELFSSRRKTIQGRRPVKEKMLRRASQSLVIEKADLLLSLLETTDIKPEFRPKVCLMIDNLISTVKRRAVKNSKKENVNQQCKRKHWNRTNHCRMSSEKEKQGKTIADSNEGREDFDAEDASFSFSNRSDKKLFGQTNGVKGLKRSSVTGAGQKNYLSKFSHS